MSSVHSITTLSICRKRVVKIESHADATLCVFGDQTRLLLSHFLGSRVAVDDEIAIAAPAGDEVGTEVLITKRAVSGRNRCLYPGAHRLRNPTKAGHKG